MTHIDAYLTSTINGMIALPDGNAPWSDATWAAYYALGKKYKAIILGRATYDIMREFAPDEFKKLGNPIVIILSKKMKHTPDKKHFTAASPAAAAKMLKKFKIKKALITGGAKTVSAFLKAGLVKRLMIDIEPQIFAQGVPLIDLKGQWRQTFKSVTSQKPSSKIVRLIYSDA